MDMSFLSYFAQFKIIEDVYKGFQVIQVYSGVQVGGRTLSMIQPPTVHLLYIPCGLLPR